MRAFISCALTHVPRETFPRYTSFIHSLANAVRSAGYSEASYALVDSDPQLAEKPPDERARLCYLWDRDLVRASDVVIAEATYPSTGMGVELEIASSMGIPVILCYEHLPRHRIEPAEYETPDHARHTLQIGEGYISLMALGLPTLFKVIAYTSMTEAFDGVSEALHLLSKDKYRD